MTSGVHRIQFTADARISGNRNVTRTNQALDRLMASNKVDMIPAMGEVSPHKSCQRNNFSKPVFAARVTDARLQGGVSTGTGGIRNLNYINTLFDMEREFEAFQKITPFSRIAIVVDEFIYESVPQLSTHPHHLKKAFAMEITLIGATDSSQKILAKTPGACLPVVEW